MFHFCVEFSWVQLLVFIVNVLGFSFNTTSDVVVSHQMIASSGIQFWTNLRMTEGCFLFDEIL